MKKVKTIREADELVAAGKFSEAVQAYRQYLNSPLSSRLSDYQRAEIEVKIAECLYKAGGHQDVLSQIALARKLLSKDDSSVLTGKLLTLTAGIDIEFSQYEQALSDAQAGYEILRHSGENEYLGVNLRIQAELSLYAGDLQEAKRLLSMSTAALEMAGGLEHEIVKNYNILAQWCFEKSDSEVALQYLEDALKVCERSGLEREEQIIRMNMGTVYRRLGKWDKAESCLTSALNGFAGTGHDQLTAQASLSLGKLYILRRDFQRASDLLQKAMELSKGKFPREEAIGLEVWADLEVARGGSLQTALDRLLQAKAIGDKISPAGDIIPETLHRIGELYLKMGEPGKAIEACTEGIGVAQKLGDRLEEGEGHRVLALAYQKSGQRDLALRHFDQAINALGSAKAPYELAKAWLARGAFLSSDEDFGRAKELFESIGAAYEVALVDLEMAQVAAPSFRSAVEGLREAEEILRAQGEAEKLREVQALKLALNRKLTQPTARKYEALQGLVSPGLGEVFEGIVRELKADEGLVAYRSNGEMLIGKTHNLAQEEATKVLSLLTDSNGFPPGGPLLLYDTALDERFSSLGAGSVMVAPLISGGKGEAEGYLYLARLRGKEPFLDKEYDLFYSLSHLAEKAISEQRQRELERELASLRKQLRLTGEIVTQDPRILRVLDEVEMIKTAAYPVIIEGESGTGKELIAKAIHSGRGRERPFMAINCAGIVDNLLESELFGHEKGAFTDAKTQHKGLFEIADGGTIFLDEIGDMSLALQAKLLRFLETQSFRRVGGTEEIKVDVRVIVATNKDLYQATQEGAFRKDLYYRIKGVTLRLPPLRERKGDLPLLCEHFMRLFGERYGKRVEGITSDALRLLRGYDWPGNVRELRHVIELAVSRIRGEKGELTAELFQVGEEKRGDVPAGDIPLPEKLALVEREECLKALRESNWKITKAANILGVPRGTLQSKMKKLGIYKELSFQRK